MTSLDLISPKEAEREIAAVFLNEFEMAGDAECLLWGQDDGAFEADSWLHLGSLRLPHFSQNHAVKSELDDSFLTKLIAFGAYELSTPTVEEAQKCLASALGATTNKDKQVNLDPVLGDISSIAIRAGLARPCFDPHALEEIPYKNPTTIVSDTSGVLQGGLDFVTKFLYPTARVKVPAIVNMELQNAADSFFAIRRREKRTTLSQRRRELVEHLKSQGGQRAMLRLELQEDTEVERTFLLGDPLRPAFVNDNDGDVAGLNISRPVRSYADRLILESARHHQAQTGPAHVVRLLTSDQGLARMSLAEGIGPLYFSATTSDQFFNNRLTGCMLHPFTGKVHSVSLAAFLWEVATAFGAAMIESKSKCARFVVKALGRDMSWFPYHSVDDLLWCGTEVVPSSKSEKRGSAENASAPNENESDRKSNLQTKQADPSGEERRDQIEAKTTFFRFDVARLCRLVCELDDSQELTFEDVTKVLGVSSTRGADEYRRFLVSTGLICVDGKSWKAESGLALLSGALRNERVEEVHSKLLAAPSYQSFVNRVEELEVGQSLEPTQFGRGLNSYRTLGEINLICAEVRGEGIYPTPNRPSASDFSWVAQSCFNALEEGDGLASAGKWLETLIRKEGIHPVVARRKLDEASELGLLRRSTEGSTTQIRNDDHIVHVLRGESEGVWIEKVHLYRGDFLIPGKASVSLRIREA